MLSKISKQEEKTILTTTLTPLSSAWYKTTWIFSQSFSPSEIPKKNFLAKSGDVFKCMFSTSLKSFFLHFVVNKKCDTQQDNFCSYMYGPMRLCYKQSQGTELVPIPYLGLVPLPLSHFVITNFIHFLANVSILCPRVSFLSPNTNRATSFWYWKFK